MEAEAELRSWTQSKSWGELLVQATRRAEHLAAQPPVELASDSKTRRGAVGVRGIGLESGTITSSLELEEQKSCAADPPDMIVGSIVYDKSMYSTNL